MGNIKRETESLLKAAEYKVKGSFILKQKRYWKVSVVYVEIWTNDLSYSEWIQQCTKGVSD